MRPCSPKIAYHAYHNQTQQSYYTAAILQASETFQGVARLEATDSLYSQDCIMLTCTPMADSATADSADTWRIITLRISSSYPSEPPSVVVRMSRDAQLAPQVRNGIHGVTSGLTMQKTIVWESILTFYCKSALSCTHWQQFNCNWGMLHLLFLVIAHHVTKITPLECFSEVCKLQLVLLLAAQDPDLHGRIP